MRPTPILFCLLICSQGQAAPEQVVRATVFNEAITVPFTSLVTTPVHPGFMAGTSLWSSDGKHLEHRIQLDVGFYHHELIENAVFILPTWQSTWWIVPRLGLSALAGLGYKHTLYPSSTFSIEDGEYSEQPSWGHPEITGTVGLGLEFPVKGPWTVIAQYRGSIDGPFSKELGLSAMGHLSTHVGVEYRR